MVKLKQVKKAYNTSLKTQKNTHHIRYEYKFDRYRANRYMCKILNKANPTNFPALIFKKLKKHKNILGSEFNTTYKKQPVIISLDTNKITIGNDSYSVKELERAVYGYTSKIKKPSLNYKIWITAKFLAKSK